MNWLYKIGITISLSWGLYFLWTKIYRFIWQRKYKGNVAARETLNELIETLNKRKWTKDTWRELGDAISYPRYFEEVGEKGILGNDCDDHAIWALNAAREGFSDGEDTYMPEGLFTVTWNAGKGLSGHNVALFKCVTPGKEYDLAHLSNWGFYKYSDRTYEFVAKDIARRFGKLAAWRLTSENLKEKLAYRNYM